MIYFAFLSKARCMMLYIFVRILGLNGKVFQAYEVAFVLQALAKRITSLCLKKKYPGESGENTTSGSILFSNSLNSRFTRLYVPLKSGWSGNTK